MERVRQDVQEMIPLRNGNTIKIPYSSLEFVKKSSPLKPYTGTREIIGFDDETLHGYARVLCSTDDALVVRTIYSILQFLTQERYEKSLNVFFNLDHDIETLLKHERRILRQFTNGIIASWHGYRMTYIPGKRFSIKTRTGRTCNYYDIAQFFKMPLAIASQKYLGIQAPDIKADRAHLFETHSLQEIVEYCTWDATTTGKLAEYFLKWLTTFGIRPRKLTSCGYLGEQLVRTNQYIPIQLDVPRIIGEMFYNAYHGGWFETYQRGVSYGNKYDIGSAYPSTIALLPDIRIGEWLDYYDPKELITVLNVTMKQKEKTMNPFIMEVQNETYYPYIDEEVTRDITGAEYESNKKDFDFTINYAYTFKPRADCTYPFYDKVKNLYEYKERVDKECPEYMVAKLLLNSPSGKFFQIVKDDVCNRGGPMFNTPYAATVTGRTRAQCKEAIKGHERDVVSIMTDSISFSKDVRLQCSNEIGGWKLEEEDKRILSLKSGIYQVEGRKPKVRGLTRKTDLFSACDTSETILEVQYIRPRHFKECFRTDRTNMIGVFSKETKYLDLNSDVRRIWEKDITHARELLRESFKSMPVPLSVLDITI